MSLGRLHLTLNSTVLGIAVVVLSKVGTSKCNKEQGSTRPPGFHSSLPVNHSIESVQ